MSVFNYQQGSLHCEGVPLEAIAEAHGTPTYVYSRQTIESAFLAYQNALADRPHLVCYAVKANSNLAILNVLAGLGAGFDVVSIGELERVIAAGGAADKVVFSGVGKTKQEMLSALEHGIRCFNVESESELLTLAGIAAKCGRTAPVSMRVNPDVDAGTHPYISTGLRENKFGVDVETARRLYQVAHYHRALEPVAIDCHIGSQILDIAPFLESLDCLLTLIDELAAEGITLRHIDIGGGLGVSYQENAPAIEKYMSALAAKLGSRDLELVMEPGRSIVALAGVLLTRVLYLKPSDAKNFAVVDAAMNDLLRPSLYDAWQNIQAVTPHKGKSRPWDIVGPICETGDFLGKDRHLALSEGDLLAAMGAGAYGFAMASNYNSRPRAAEVMVSGGSVHLVGQRENLGDLWQRERIPENRT
ncbi:MAG: diaminopimelate decarboxylase [Pseudomonadota bacterium]|nr:diaminopimelate decarboxylase [Pseudomonadota bacterium]